jgi:hypothetical protein
MKEANDLREEEKHKSRADDQSERDETLKRLGIVGAIALIAFLLGFIPGWLSARGYENELETMRKTLRPNELQNKLATATINARRGSADTRAARRDNYTACPKRCTGS